MAKKTEQRRGLRLSRPDSEQFLTVMFVFAHRTFRWSLERRILVRILGTLGGIWAVAMICSAYGLWATKKLMSFTQLQQETYNQKEQLRESLNQAQALDDEIKTLRKQIERAIHDGQGDQAKTLYRDFAKRVDQAASVSTLHHDALGWTAPAASCAKVRCRGEHRSRPWLRLPG